MPAADALPGGSRYEPKWDGYRVLLLTGTSPTLLSRHGTDLTRYFPEVTDAVADLPPGWVLDAELVVFRDGRLDFGALQQRVHPARSRVRELALAAPASLVAFDVLFSAAGDMRPLSYVDRRALLADLVGRAAGVQLTPMTADRDEALDWMDAWSAEGIEGLVVKGATQPYRGGRRDWVKVRREVAHDVIVGGVQGSIARPDTLVLGLPDEAGELRVVGMTRPLSAAQRRELDGLLEPAGERHPWPSELPRSRLGQLAGQGGPVAYTRVRPELVVEIRADSSFEGGKWRHTVVFRRARPDVDAAEVEPPMPIPAR